MLEVGDGFLVLRICRVSERLFVMEFLDSSNRGMEFRFQGVKFLVLELVYKFVFFNRLLSVLEFIL